MPRWIEVGKEPCQDCNGIGLSAYGRSVQQYYDKQSLINEGHRCDTCEGKPMKSVGYWADDDPWREG